MGRIQSSIGLISGINIGDTVSKLMELASRPKQLLVNRTEVLKNEQIAVTELSALLLAVQYATNHLGTAAPFEARQVQSSDPASLAVTATGNPPPGVYQFTPLRTVQNQQWLSAGVRSDTAALGGGTLTLRFGPTVERGTPAELLNGGEGFVRGKIRITDRSGARAEIDLSTAQTIDDVLAAINSSQSINVTAVAQGDRIRLIDNTGRTLSNLIVQEVGGGKTAESLGLSGIDASASIADGRDLVRLYDELDVAALNDGNGVDVHPALPDIGFVLRDGTAGNIDFSEIQQGSSNVQKETTLGQIIAKINAAAPGKLRAEISADGDRLVVRDLTSGSGELQLYALYDSEALGDLGLDQPASGGVITGRRLLGGLKSVLVSSLNGGKGLGPLGMVELTDRTGNTDTVNLAGAETLDEVVRRLNAAGVGISARINRAGNGIELADTTGGQASNLIVADLDDKQTARKLGIAVDQSAASVNSGDLHLQIISASTPLASLNGGRGVARGTLLIQDSRGNQRVLDLRDTKIQTVGDVLTAIYRLNLRVYADINETGDGIRLRDLDNAGGTLAVYEGETTTARDLGIFREARSASLNGQPTQVIDGSMTRTIELGASDSLATLRAKINELGMGVAATTLVDGSSRPFRLALLSQQSGKAGAVVVDASRLGLDFQEVVAAQDALVLLGDPASAATGILASSTTNQFKSLLPGATIEAKQATGRSATVVVERTDAKLVSAVKSMVDTYNKFRKRLLELTKYDAETNKRSLLTGDAAALRLDNDLSYLISGQFLGAGTIRSLGEVGLSLKDDGTMDLNEQRLKDAFAADPDAVRKFFTQADVGVSARFKKTIDSFTARDVSLLAQRYKALRETIARNEARIEAMTKVLDIQQQRLYTNFYRMETAIGKMQSSLSALAAIQPIAPLSTGSGSSAS